MKEYWEYFKYVMVHKKNVFIECWKEGLYLHAFTHDLSKFLPTEFKAYAINFYAEKDCKRCDRYFHCDLYKIITLGSGEYAKECADYNYEDFNEAWKHHYRHNKHHWNYWIGKEIPEKYIKQMICDWKAMSRKFGGTVQEFYMKNHDTIEINHNSRVLLEFNLGLIDGVCLVSNIDWEEACKRQGKTMLEDLIELGYSN